MTPRKIILSALRIIGAIKTGEAPTADMFEESRNTLNDLLALWSAEELMPYDIAQTELDLFAGVPNYSISAGSDLDGNGVCLVQTPGGAGNLTINGALASGGVATLDVPRHIIITSSANDSGRTFTVTGTNSYGDSISEVITGPNTNTVRGYKQFKTVTQIAISGAATGSITVGSDWILNCRRPVQIVDAFVRDSSGIDWPVFPITHDRYTEIRDKDETGAPTKFYYRRSYPSGEAYIHPVPSTGIVLTITSSDVEHISNGGFASSSGWTLESQWTVVGGVLVRTPGTGDAILGNELITDGGFAADLSNWTPGDQWAWASAKAKRTPGTGAPILDGIERVVNGTFTGNANSWSLTNWVYGTNQIDYANNLTGRIAAQSLSGLAAGDSCYVQYTLLAHSGGLGVGMNGGNVTVNLGGVNGTARTAFGTYQDTILFGNSVLNIVANAANPAIMRVGCDNVSVQKITGYESTGPDSLIQSLTLTNGTTYRVVYTISGCTQGNITLKVAGTSGTIRTTDNTFTEDVVAGATNQIEFEATDGDFDGNIDDVSIKEITGYGEVGADSAKQLETDLATVFTVGDTYRLTFAVSNYVAGTCTPSIGDTNGTSISADGNYSIDIICGSGADFELAASSDFEGTFDNISIIDWTETYTLTGGDYQLFLDCWLPFVEFGPEDIDTEINLPGAYIMAMRWGLAVELAPDYGRDVSLFVYERSKSYLDTIRFSNTRLPKPTLINWPILTVNRQPAINRN